MIQVGSEGIRKSTGFFDGYIKQEAGTVSAGVDLISRRRIFCKVTVTVGSDTKDRLLGPVDILLPKIQLPTVLVMTQHAVTGQGYPGAVLVAVPSQSLLELDRLTDKLQEVQVVLNRLQTVSQVIGFGETIEQINRIIELIGNPTSGFHASSRRTA